MLTDTLIRKTQPVKQHFLPTRRRIDREINKLKFAYKGEVIMGLTASYGTLSSDDTDVLLILDNINADGTMATIRPFVGYFYRDNRCLGARFGYTHMSGTLDKGAIFDLGESNDVSLNIPYLDFKSDNYSYGIFHRSYAVSTRRAASDSSPSSNSRSRPVRRASPTSRRGRSNRPSVTIRSSNWRLIRERRSTSSPTSARPSRSDWAVSSTPPSPRRTNWETRSAAARPRT